MSSARSIYIRDALSGVARIRLFDPTIVMTIAATLGIANAEMSPAITPPAALNGGLGSEVRVAQLSGPPASLTENIIRMIAIVAHVAALTNFCKVSNYKLRRSIDIQ